MVAPSLEILGGQGVQASDLTEALQKEGFTVLFVPVNPRFPFGFRWLRKVPYLRTVLNQVLYVLSLYRLRRVDVVHIFSASYWSFLLAPVPAILACRLFGKRSILNYHSGEADDHLSGWGRRVHPWLRLVDEIVVPSEYLQRVFTDHGYKTRVIRNIVDTSDFKFRARSPLQPKLLSTRNLETLYDVDNTLRAYQIFKQRRPDASLTIAGYGRQADMLKKRVYDEGIRDVRFIGRIEPNEMPAVYDQSDIFLNSSMIDNQPVSILEAFAAGLAVISTPTGDIPAMVKHEVSGLIVAHKDPAAMASAIETLLADPSRTSRMTQQALREVDKYTWAQVCNVWSELYNRES